jgi:hypothetical protein
MVCGNPFVLDENPYNLVPLDLNDQWHSQDFNVRGSLASAVSRACIMNPGHRRSHKRKTLEIKSFYTLTFGSQLYVNVIRLSNADHRIVRYF